MTALLFIVAMITGCDALRCAEYSKVKTLGQCSYSSVKVEGYGFGNTDCAAMLENGAVVRKDRPLVIGESVCARYGAK